MKSIYKYMPHYNGKFFDHFFLRATPRNELNDPFEFVPTSDIYEMIMKYIKSSKQISLPKKYNYDKFCKDFLSFQGVISFTETRSNLLMWSHYCDRHSGLVLEFDTTKEFFKDLKRVKYDNVKPNKIENYDDLFFIKSESWIYEKEYRIIKNLSEHDHYIKTSDQSVHPPKKSATHFTEECLEMYMYCSPKDSIKSVTFGCNTTDKIKDIIYAKVSNDDELKNIQFWQTKLSKNYYYLDFEKIN